MVIAIIAVLASMLLPALQRARASANAANCLNNMRQFGIAVTSFSNENQDRIPSTYQGMFNRRPGSRSGFDTFGAVLGSSYFRHSNTIPIHKYGMFPSRLSGLNDEGNYSWDIAEPMGGRASLFKCNVMQESDPSRLVYAGVSWYRGDMTLEDMEGWWWSHMYDGRQYVLPNLSVSTGDWNGWQAQNTTVYYNSGMTGYDVPRQQYTQGTTTYNIVPQEYFVGPKVTQFRRPGNKIIYAEQGSPVNDAYSARGDGSNIIVYFAMWGNIYTPEEMTTDGGRGYFWHKQSGMAFRHQNRMPALHADGHAELHAPKITTSGLEAALDVMSPLW